MSNARSRWPETRQRRHAKRSAHLRTTFLTIVRLASCSSAYRDKGTPVGLAITDALLRQLADMKSDGNLIPPPTMVVEKRTLLGADVAVVTVMPADAPPVSYRGRIWIRVGPRREIASAQDERILNEKRRFRDRTFDAHPLASTSLSDLSRSRFEEDYLPASVARDVLVANERSYEQRLAAAKMVSSPDDPVPTVAGILVLGTRVTDYLPGAYVQFLRVDGASLSDPIRDDSSIQGPISDLLRRLEEKLDAHNEVAVDLITPEPPPLEPLCRSWSTGSRSSARLVPSSPAWRRARTAVT